jgi:four helix bundle protein
MNGSTYRTLIAWQRAIELVVLVYEVSKCFPPDERFGLTQQIRRAAVSIPANIAEGRGRGSRADYRRFLHQARGSVYEVETHATIADRLRYIDAAASESLGEKLAAVVRPLNGLIGSLE